MWSESRRNNESVIPVQTRQAAKWFLTGLLSRRGYPIDGGTTPIPQSSGERSSGGTSRI
jgi:hypothetical protein